MKKYNLIKMCKRLLIIIVVFLLCLENFAAIVSDDDSSAFVSKSEFEMFKNSINDGIKQYTDSVASKIDGAVASYLSDLKLNNPITYDTINKKWKEVTFINGVYDNEYVIPDINYLVGLNGRSQRTNGSTVIDIRAFDSNFIMNYKRSEGVSNRKNCFIVLEGTEGAPTKIYWRGIAKSYREKIVCSIQNGVTGSSFGAFCWPDSDYTKRVLCNYPLKCQSATYSLNYDTRIFGVTVTPQYKTASGGSWQNASGTALVDSWNVALSNLDIELDSINGSQYDTEHIVGWGENTEWELYCPNWKKTWQLSSNQTINDLTMYNGISKDSKGWYAGQENQDGAQRNAAGSMPFTFVNSSGTTTNMFYSVGLYATPVKNNAIYQREKSEQYTSTDTFEVPNVTLEQGLPILAGIEDDEVDFKPIIKSVKCFDETGAYVTNMNEVDIYLSYVPFTEKNISTDPVMIKQLDGTEKAYVTTSDRKGKINFKMTKKSVVYMQMMPHFDSTATIGPNGTWEIVLDLTGDGGTYVLVSSAA